MAGCLFHVVHNAQIALRRGRGFRPHARGDGFLRSRFPRSLGVGEGEGGGGRAVQNSVTDSRQVHRRVLLFLDRRRPL